MDGTAIIVIATGTNTVALGVVLFAVKKIVNNSIKGLEKRLDNEKDDRVKIDNELWTAVNKHGHKGLDKNGSRVTR